MRDIYRVLRREIRIFRQRQLYILASVGVMIFNAVFYLTLMQDGLPHDLPVGIVDCDRSSTSRSFCQQLDATQLGRVIYYDDLHRARLDMQRGKLTACIVIPEEFNADIQASRQPHIGYYVNSLYFVGGALSYSNILTMVNLTNGAVQRQVLRARGVNEKEILARIQPIVLDTHQIGNTTTSYGVYLNSVILPGVLEMIVILITVYAIGSELKYGTSRHLMKTAGGSIVKALAGKMAVYTLIFTVLGITLELLLYHWLHYPIKGSIWWMFVDILLLVAAAQAVGMFIIGLFPNLRLAVSVSAIYSVLGFSLAGFTLPVEAMMPALRGFSAIFPLRHYYLFYVQEAIFGSGFAGWWQQAVSLLIFLGLPLTVVRRLEDAYIHVRYERD
ncbi:MAG: ABC transporter permease [Bacteroidales bacterium]|nr:ABC transporter permease [Bacteroidales bacterium]